MLVTRHMMAVSAANNRFALALHHELRASPGNLVYSPYSITLAMALVYAGAEGRTRDEIGEVLGFGAMGDDVHRSLSKISEQVGLQPPTNSATGGPSDRAGEAEFQLEIANSLWRQLGIAIEPAYLALVERMYDVALAEVDFQGAPAEACRTINDWARDSTRGLIPEIIQPCAVGPLTRLCLANAIYFKALWPKPFEQELTRPRDFHCLDGRTEPVPMMHRRENLFYWETDELQAVALPYRGTATRLLVVMPRPGLFERVERQIDAERFGTFLGSEGVYRKRRVHLGLPSFRIGWTTNLRPALEALGLRRLFGDDADLSTISRTTELLLDEVVHSGHIRVDETGTEAAAVTTTLMVATGAEKSLEPVEMIVDQPFLFFVVDESTRTILFAGRMIQPEMSDPPPR